MPRRAVAIDHGLRQEGQDPMGAAKTVPMEAGHMAVSHTAVSHREVAPMGAGPSMMMMMMITVMGSVDAVDMEDLVRTPRSEVSMVVRAADMAAAAAAADGMMMISTMTTTELS
mmetsp:Transcript_144819/g.361153  ORF Transcript_144819/g.361153 Transcript_144819/m.361153 type:complete len:114 (+) Transcript_144819:1987-2328(+)